MQQVAIRLAVAALPQHFVASADGTGLQTRRASAYYIRRVGGEHHRGFAAIASGSYSLEAPNKDGEGKSKRKQQAGIRHCRLPKLDDEMICDKGDCRTVDKGHRGKDDSGSR